MAKNFFLLNSISENMYYTHVLQKPFDASPHISNASAKAISNRYVSSLLQYNNTTIPIINKASDMAIANKKNIYSYYLL